MEWIDKLRELKAQSSLSTREIAKLSGIPEPTLEKLFAGQTKNPGINTVQQLVHSLGHTLDDLVDSPIPIKKASSISDEAMNIAKRYQNLDIYGKSLIRSVMVEEENRIKEQSVARRQMIQAAAYGGGVNQIPEIYLDEVPTDKEPLP